ncbi:MAG: acetylglutamate kinase [Chloroflexi bacterium AL-W]|nr:acetylglutamate kinase [Chloroflexi bacterium AL-W]
MEIITLLKIGGKILDDEPTLDQLLDDFCALSGPKVLIHGGGKAATEMAARLGLEAMMVEGRRVTDAAMLEVVVMVYAGLVNKQVVAKIQARGQTSVGLTGADFGLMLAHKRPVVRVDYGWVGDVDQVDGPRVQWLLDHGVLPVVAPITHDGRGQLLNTNADTMAAAIANALAPLAPVRLVYSFEKPGVLRDPTDDHSVISLITPSLFLQYREAGVIAGGMVPKLEAACSALEAGVEEVVICQAKALRQVGTPGFVGTVIRKD